METYSWAGRLYILLLTLCALLLPAHALATEELNVGYVPGTGFVEEDRPGHLRGNGYEYMEFLSGFLGAKFTYVPCVNWWEAGAKLNSGEIDLLPAMPGDYKSLPFARRTDHVIARFPMELVVQDDFAGGQVLLGTLDYNYPTPNLARVAKEHGFNYELISFNEPAAMKDAFASRAIDGYIQPLLHPEKKERVLALFDRVSYRLLLRQDRTELFDRVNAAQDNLLLNQPNIRNRLNDKYERSKGFPLVLTPEEQAYLQEKKILKVAVLMNNKPFFWQDADETWTGATKALLDQLEADLGIKIEPVEEKSLTEVHRLLKRGTIDMVADVPCDFSWLEEIGLLPTQPYLDIGFVPITKHGGTLPKSPKVAAVDGLFETVTFVKASYPEEQILYCKSLEECCYAVSNGLADITYIPRATAPTLLESSSAYNLSADTEQVYTSTISLGISQSADSRLWQILNKEINHLPPGMLTTALNQGTHEHIRHLSPRYLLYHYPQQSALLIFLTMSIIMGIIYYRSRHHRQQLADMETLTYRDDFSHLPNRRYLEHNLVPLMEKIPPGPPKPACYLALFAATPKEAIASRHILAPHMQEAARFLTDREWVLAAAAGNVTGELICLCTAQNSRQMLNFAAEMVTDLNSRQEEIRWQAGCCPMAGSSLPQAEERALQACQEAIKKEIPVQIWDKTLQL